MAKEGVSKLNLHGLKAQYHIAQGNALGIMVYIMNNAPCKGNTLIIRLLPLQGVWGVWVPFTQGAALGYVLLPLRGVLFMSFDTPSKSYLISTRNVDAGSFAPFTRLARVNGCHP